MYTMPEHIVPKTNTKHNRKQPNNQSLKYTLWKDQSGSTSHKVTWLSQWQFSYSGLIQIHNKFKTICLRWTWLNRANTDWKEHTFIPNQCQKYVHSLGKYEHWITVIQTSSLILLPLSTEKPSVWKALPSCHKHSPQSKSEWITRSFQFLTTRKNWYSFKFTGIILTSSKNISPPLCHSVLRHSNQPNFLVKAD